MSEMNIRQYLAARERAAGRVTLGFAGIADFRSVIGQEYIAGVTQAAADYRVNLLNFAGAIKYSVSGDIDFISHYLKKYRFMRPGIIDGLIAWASSLSVFLSCDEIRELHNRLKPLPIIDLGVPILEGVPGVTIRNTDCMRLVMEHLIGFHGYTRMGFIGCSTGSQYAERLADWRLELERHGLEEESGMVGILPSLEQRDIHRWIDTLQARFDLRSRRSIDVIVTVSDVAAANVIEDLRLRGIMVPRDVAVTGINNQLHSTRSSCPITTIDLGYYRRGYAAVEMLLERIADPGLQMETRIADCSLVVRRSCGCFEETVEEAGSGASLSTFSPAPGTDLPSLLEERLHGTLPSASGEPGKRLAEALGHDLEGKTDDGFLSWLQRELAMEDGPDSRKFLRYQELVSVLRRTVLSLTAPGDGRRERMEDIFHKARVMAAVSGTYRGEANRTDAYRFNNLARIAVSFASAHDGPQVLDAVRSHLGELEIPGIMLVLQEELSQEMGGGSLEFIHPADLVPGAALPVRISESSFVPRSCFPKERNWVMMLEILYCSGMYIGYVLIEMGPADVALYDAVRTLLSRSLYTVYMREGRTPGSGRRLLRTERVAEILGADKSEGRGRSGIDTESIVRYLEDRLGEMTDLERMAEAFSVSKSYLIRRTRTLTGYTVQALHELLKIERAKHMLETRGTKVSEIANRLGYQSQCYFSSVFRKHTGMSPTAWMKRRE